MSQEDSQWRHVLEDSTVRPTPGHSVHEARPVPGLTVLWHPNPRRVGDRALLVGLRKEGAELSRLEPSFEASVGACGEASVEAGLEAMDGGERQPLVDLHLSRKPLLIRQKRDDRIEIDCAGSATEVRVDGKTIDSSTAIAKTRLREGVVLVLAGRVALLLHELVPTLPVPQQGLGLVGANRRMIELGEDVVRVRDLPVPVLLKGETGTGKELVARAIHETGSRSSNPFVAVNMAALPPSLAAAELFGATKGAFTGADRPRPGLFREADGGTLFLDEIGEMPSEVQVLLLRVLEEHEVRALGAVRSQRIDVRVVAATDSDLEGAIAAGSFSEPLHQRFGGYEITMPPLRTRRDDLGRLFLHFLEHELKAMDRLDRLADPGPDRAPWMPAALFEAVASHAWPGNVRELRNLVRRLVIRYRDAETVDAAEVGAGLTQRGAAAENEPEEPAKPKKRKLYRAPMEVSERELLETLREQRWEIKQTAKVLRISRGSLYKLIDRNPQVRKASELGRDEIAACWQRCGGSLEKMVDNLEISKHALRARMQELDLP